MVEWGEGEGVVFSVLYGLIRNIFSKKLLDLFGTSEKK